MKKLMTTLAVAALTTAFAGTTYAADAIYKEGNGGKNGNILTVPLAWEQTAAE